ncbi:MAG: asparagine synthase (glutamine-hydrolyzing) [Planctomycetota bacterium]
MCGINGILGTEGASALEGVERMNARLVHRGPDEGGAVARGACALGMRRLSILDLASGAQPMTSACGRFTIVYNGECYDTDELRAELEAEGARFRTTTDTEVVLELWARRGRRALDVLNGMFAFAVHDARADSVTLVRDPVGIKPLFLWRGPGGELAFSSELASLLEHAEIPRRIDRRSLATLLVDRSIPDPHTLFEGVEQLPPGHIATWVGGRLHVERYWTYALAPEPMTERDAVRELRQRLESSVRSQLVADVPVGVFLSGGIDSSTVAALAAREVDAPLHTFSVGFASPEYDESAVAREVAVHLGTVHHELRVEDAEYDPALLDRIVDHVGQPLGDLSCIPTWLVSRFAREEVTVALSGDGGDELFGGYDHMKWAARVQRVADRTPAFARRMGQAVLAGAALVPAAGIAERTRRARKGLALTFLDRHEQLRRLMSLHSEEEAAALLGERRALHPWADIPEETLEGLAPEEFAMAVLAQTYMTSAILTKVDRMSMAASLEVRVPILDRRVVEFALRCPLEHKVRGAVGKHVLRQSGRPLLPDAVYSAPKRGFGLPIGRWFDGAFWDQLEELFRPGRPAASLFDERALRRTIERGRAAHLEGARVSRQAAAARVWLLAQIGRWMERFGVAA